MELIFPKIYVKWKYVLQIVKKTYNMYPLTAIELNSDSSLEKSLKFGHLPSIPSEPDPFEFLKAYVKTYLREEVLQEGLTRNLGSFTRFLEMASFSQASILNMSEVAREASLERKQEIKAINDYFNYQYDLYYWRTSNGVEVDIVLYGPKGIMAFEVKRSKRITKKDLSGLKAFKSDFPEATLYLLYGGTKALYEDGIKILPVDYALKQIPGILENKDNTLPLAP